MTNIAHDALTGIDLHVPGYVQSTDPAITDAVVAGKVWIDTSRNAGNWAIKYRNATNNGWEYAAYVGADVRISTASRPTLKLDDSAGSTLLGRVVFAANGVSKLSLTYDLSTDQFKVYDEVSSVTRMSLDRATGKLTVAGEANILGDLNHDGTSVGFYGTAPVLRPTYLAMTGTADRTTAYATSTVTLAQLAGRVRAIEDDLKSVGLFN